MNMRLGSKVVHNGYIDEALEGKIGTVVASDDGIVTDVWYLVEFDDWYDGHDGHTSQATKIKKGFTYGGNSCWWCPKKSLKNVKEGVK